MGIAIKVVNASKSYRKKKDKIVVLKSFSYEFCYGKMYAIMGQSGSGKTTLINCLSMLDNLDSGNIYINQINIKKMNEKNKAQIRNKEIGMVFQNFLLNNHMKSFENVMLPMFLNKNIKKNKRKEIALNLLDKVGIKSKWNSYPKDMSGGEQQRVAIARALANNPNIIMADEPTGNLDAKNEKSVFKLLKSLATEGKCVIIVSHEHNIKKYADEVIILNEKANE